MEYEKKKIILLIKDRTILFFYNIKSVELIFNHNIK